MDQQRKIRVPNYDEQQQQCFSQSDDLLREQELRLVTADHIIVNLFVWSEAG